MISSLARVMKKFTETTGITSSAEYHSILPAEESIAVSTQIEFPEFSRDAHHPNSVLNDIESFPFNPLEESKIDENASLLPKFSSVGDDDLQDVDLDNIEFQKMPIASAYHIDLNSAMLDTETEAHQCLIENIGDHYQSFYELQKYLQSIKNMADYIYFDTPKWYVPESMRPALFSGTLGLIHAEHLYYPSKNSAQKIASSLPELEKINFRSFQVYYMKAEAMYKQLETFLETYHPNKFDDASRSLYQKFAKEYKAFRNQDFKLGHIDFDLPAYMEKLKAYNEMVTDVLSKLPEPINRVDYAKVFEQQNDISEASLLRSRP